MLPTQSTDDPQSSDKMSLRTELWALLIAISITIGALVYLFQLWGLHPRVPILYSGDGLLTLNGLRNMRFGNWYWSTNKLGAPFGQDLHDFPAVADNLHLAMLWVGVKVLRNEVLTFNLFFFGTYLLTTAGGFTGARMLKIKRPAAVLIGVVFSFLPYHFQHGPGHLYLSAYWAIPLWVAFLVRELMGDSIFKVLPNSKCLSDLFNWCRQRSSLVIAAISICAASTGLYYAFFFLILATFVLCIRRLTQSASFQWVPIAWALCVATATMALQYFPIWLYQKQNGSNLSIVQRSISQVEYYSLKISNLILPVGGHRISQFADLRNKANPVYLVGEGTEALGLLGAFGLLALLCFLVYRPLRNSNRLLPALSSFAIMSILVCTVGGFAQVFAAFGFTQLRVWSRMSVVIAFPAIVCAVYLLSFLIEKRKRVTSLFILTFVGTLALLDTNPARLLPSYDKTARAWESDRYLVQQVETAFGQDAIVFQLPIVPFPENPPVVNMTDYEHLRGHFHSSTLRWSYGGVKGRSGDWQSSLPTDPKLLIARLQNLGFQAVWVDRNGYEDNGASLIASLKAAGLTTAISDANTSVFPLK
jgi:phosphoglycerol transferase